LGGFTSRDKNGKVSQRAGQKGQERKRNYQVVKKKKKKKTNFLTQNRKDRSKLKEGIVYYKNDSWHYKKALQMEKLLFCSEGGERALSMRLTPIRPNGTGGPGRKHVYEVKMVGGAY